MAWKTTRRNRWLPVLCCAVLCLLFWASYAVAEEMTTEEVSRQLIVEGDKAMSRGRDHFQEALGKYTEALLKTPTNVRALFSRAQVASRMRQVSLAMEDLDTLLRLSAQHVAALELRVSLSLQQGDLRQAVADTASLLPLYRQQKKGPTAELEERLRRLKQLSLQWDHLQHVIDADPTHLPSLSPSRESARRRHFGECVRLLGTLIEDFSRESVALRLKRAGCAVAVHQGGKVTADLKYVLHQEPQNLLGIAYNAMAMRSLGSIATAKSELQRCLSIDPENARCAKLFKLVRAEEKNTASVKSHLSKKEFEKALSVLHTMAKLEANPPYATQLEMWRCEVYVGLRRVEEGLKACGSALDSGNFDEVQIRLHMAELHLHNDDLKAAEAQLAVAKEMQPSHEKIREMMHKIEQLRRNAGRKDYYKILGVPKTAEEKEIRRAYRKLAKEQHPDRLRSKDLSPKQREEADRLFRDMNEAKEILLDAEKRAAYDRGEDPANPNAQANPGGQPFYGQQFHFTGFPPGGFPGGFPGGGFPGGGFQTGGGGGRQQTFFFQRR